MMNFDLIYRKVLLQNNVKSNSKKNISRVLTCKRTLSNISEVGTFYRSFLNSVMCLLINQQ